MNKVIPIVALCAAAIITTMVLNGCGDKTESNQTSSGRLAEKSVLDDPTLNKTPPAQQYLNAFLSIHNQFCEKKYISAESLKKELAKAPELSLAKNFEGVYEVIVSDISFAVSPEEDGCTTDVMVQRGEKELFTFEDINQALLNKGYVETGDSVSRKDRGMDQSELTVIEKKYISPSGEVTTLDFPLEKKDKYYMTLFAEKFTEAKREIKEKMLRSLMMASL